jgi:adenosylmethionine-8-amino-7-oxononanoate aminotransferase
VRQVCSERGIVLIFDEVFVGFRLAPGGAQEYFGVRPTWSPTARRWAAACRWAWSAAARD